MYMYVYVDILSYVHVHVHCLYIIHVHVHVCVVYTYMYMYMLGVLSHCITLRRITGYSWRVEFMFDNNIMKFMTNAQSVCACNEFQSCAGR